MLQATAMVDPAESASRVRHPTLCPPSDVLGSSRKHSVELIVVIRGLHYAFSAAGIELDFPTLVLGPRTIPAYPVVLKI